MFYHPSLKEQFLRDKINFNITQYLIILKFKHTLKTEGNEKTK